MKRARFWREALIAAAVVLFGGVSGCDDPSAPAGPGGGGGGDAISDCARPGPGCACDAGSAPLPCYGEVVPGSGGVTCHEGSMYCRGGAWSGCENIESYFVESAPGGLIEPPTACSLCNPDCFIARDDPDNTDLDVTNSSGVEYNSATGGIELNGCGQPPSPLGRWHFDDASGDTSASISDRAPAVPSMNLTAGGVTPANVAFGTDATYGGYAAVSGARLEATETASDDLAATLIAANAVTAEMWVTTADGGQTGPKRIMTLSEDTSTRAFSIMQEGGDVVVRFRTSATNAQGDTLTAGAANAVLTASNVFPNVIPAHIVVTWDGTTGLVNLYVDGALMDTVDHVIGADLSTWSLNDKFGLGDEFTDNRTWAGTFYHAAVYGQALPETTIWCRTQAGPDPMDSFDDSDGDGVADDADECVGPGFRVPCDGDPTNDGLFFSLPFGGVAELGTLDISTTITTADIYLLMDASGSMGGEIGQLKTDLTTGTFDGSCAAGVNGGVLGALQCVIPGAYFGVGFFVEYPDGTHGDANSVPYRNLLDITSDVTAAQAAVNSLRTDGNIDIPESQSQALYATVTGEGLGPWVPNRATCPDPTSWGYPCFRDGTIPIVMVFTDAPFHNGPSGTFVYSSAADRNGTFIPEAIAPASQNDTIGTAYNLGNITGQAFSIMGSTYSLTNAMNSGCNSDNREAVFTFSLSGDSSPVFSTEISDFNTVAAIWDTNPTSLGCNDDHSGAGHPWSRTSEGSVSLNANTYHATVDGNGGRGSYMFTIDDSGGTAGSTTTAIPLAWTDTVAALNARSVKIVTVVSEADTAAQTTDARADAAAVGTATGSVDGGGTPFSYWTDGAGIGLGTAVVDGVFDVANNTLFDVELVPEDNPGTTTIDETGFVDSISVTDCPIARCSGGVSGNMCLDCLPGTDVGFTAAFRNDIVMPALAPQVFEFDMVLIADGSIELGRTPVRIVIPPEVPFFPTDGVYTQTYDSTTHCDVPTTRPDWGDFDYTVDTLSDSAITFRFQTAPTLTELASANSVNFTVPTSVPSGAPPLDIGQFLVDNGESNFLPYLKVTAVLQSSSDTVTSPVLYEITQEFTCTPAE